MRKVILFFVMVALCGCEKVVFDEPESKGDKEGNVKITFSPVGKATGTRAGEVMLSEVCGRLNVAVFNAEGKKVKTVAQTVADAGFGTIGMTLADGEYTVVAVAHNCTGSATITSTEKVTFPSNKVTDTFYHFGTMTVTGERQSLEMGLQRAVAMVRIMLSDDATAMANVTQLKVYYTGGSSTFSPKAGFGCVNSKQTEYRAVNDEGVYEVYTLPHSEEDVITKMTVTALDAGDNVVGECTLEDVPVTINKVTECDGSLSGGGGAISVSISVNPEWDGVNRYTF